MTGGMASGAVVQTRNTAVTPLEYRAERRRNREVAPRNLDTCRKRRVFRTTSEGTHGRSGTQKLVNHEAPDSAGGTGHEHHFAG